MEKYPSEKRKIYDPEKFKLIGRQAPEKENRVIIWILIAMIATGVVYVLSFYI
jgi:hypothetical protein